MTATMTVKNRKLSAIQIMELKNDILFLSLSFGEFFGFVNGLVHLTITEYHSGFPVAIAWAHYHLSVHYIVIMHIKIASVYDIMHKNSAIIVSLAMCGTTFSCRCNIWRTAVFYDIV